MEKLGVFKDADESIKSVFKTSNGIIEMTLLQNRMDTDVICVPTHYYCNLGCKMCHLTNESGNKKMIPISFDNFIIALIRSLSVNDKKRTNKKKLLISFMGVGEPLMNLDLIKDVYLNEILIKEKLGYESVGYALSTMMPNDELMNFKWWVNMNNMPIKVHFSLHSPIDEKRKELIPGTKVGVREALDILKYYDSLNKNRKLVDRNNEYHSSLTEIHYTLIKGINDSDEELELLTDLLNEYKINIKFIDFNPKENMEVSTKAEKFISTIKANIPDIKVKKYSPPGKNIGASCGEFTKHYYLSDLESPREKLEFEIFKRKYRIYEAQRRDAVTWDELFMLIAKASALRSKDPNTQVGACIVSEDNRILSIGYNGAPNGFLDDRFPWERKGEPLETKYMYVMHAERNAILNYRGYRRDFEGATIYVDLFPCNECAKEIIQCGIKKVVYLSDKYKDQESTIASKRLFDECGVEYVQLGKEHQKDYTLSLKI